MVRLVALSFAGTIFGCGASQNAVERTISQWVLQQLNTRYGTGECTDLLRGAEDAARAAGFSIPSMTRGCYSDNSIYCWSDNEISLNEIQPGDFVQFHNWDERITTDNGWYTKDAHHHSAVVRETFDGAVLKVWEQNQGAVNNGKAGEGIYHPYIGTGDIHVFRMGGGSGPSPAPSPAPSPTPSPSPSSSCSDYSGWRNQDNDSCSTYGDNNYCTKSGRKGNGWRQKQWGNIHNYYDSDGNTAFDACCACGGGNGGSLSQVVV